MKKYFYLLSGAYHPCGPVEAESIKDLEANAAKFHGFSNNMFPKETLIWEDGQEPSFGNDSLRKLYSADPRYNPDFWRKLDVNDNRKFPNYWRRLDKLNKK